MSDAPLSPLLKRYSTPAELETLRACRLLQLPANMEVLAAVDELISRLTSPQVWDDSAGGVTAEDMASTLGDVFSRYVLSEVCMVGQIVAYASVNPPDGTLACDGQQYENWQYPLLYAAIDPSFKSPPNLFQVPDLRGRVPVGEDETDIIGLGIPLLISMVGGSPLVGLLLQNLWKHKHSVSSHNHTATIQTGEQNAYLRRVADGAGALDVIVAGGGGNFDYADDTTWFDGVTVNGSGELETSEEGDNEPHENMQPYQVLRYAIYYR